VRSKEGRQAIIEGVPFRLVYYHYNKKE